VYSGLDEDTAFLKHRAAIASAAGASVHFVQLRCLVETLLKRVTDPSRHRFTKMSDPEELARNLKRNPLTKSVSEFQSMEIDTDDCGVYIVADRIIDRIRRDTLLE